MRLNNKHTIYTCLLAVILLAGSCASKFTGNYYRKNSVTINSIYEQYNKLYFERPFSIGFKDRTFNYISLEILKDTIRYIYTFRLDEQNLADTLDKHQFNTAAVINMIHDMQTIRCTSINKMDFYVNRQKEYMIYLSVREQKLNSLLKPEKYYTIAFFSKPQQFDALGRLKATASSTYPMKVNNALYRKITDRICYAITENFK